MMRPQFRFSIGGKVVPRQPNAAEEIYFEVSQPLRITHFGEAFRLEDSQIIYEDVGLGHPLDELYGAFRSSEVRLDSMYGALQRRNHLV